MERSKVVVVGAGIAGLVAARELTAGHDVVVLDKGRGMGGRMATRRIGDATFDHGAQFVTAHTEAFAATVGQWQADGVIEPWFRGRLGPTGVDGTDGHVRHRGVPAMTAIAKHVASGLDVRTSARVASIERSGRGWSVALDDGEALAADAVVLTPPVPQSLELLDRGGVVLDPEDRAVLESVEYDPCLAVLVPLDGPSGLPEPGAVSMVEGPIDVMTDNSVKGVSDVPCVTIHATAAFSRQHWESSDQVVIAALLDAADLAAATVADDVQVQRWRYARPTVLDPHPCRQLQWLPPIVCAGDAFGGPKVEGATLSGLAAAREVRSLLLG